MDTFSKTKECVAMDTFSWEAALSKLFCLPSVKRSTLRGSNLLPPGAIFESIVYNHP